MSCHESNLRLALATGFNIESVVSAVNKSSSCAGTRQIVQHTKKKRIITKARNTENTKGKSSDGLMNC
jgi:hypothetical protein